MRRRVPVAPRWRVGRAANGVTWACAKSDLLAGPFPAPGPQVDPGVATDELSLGRRLEAWRAGIEARVLAWELAVPDSLGRPPADPAARAAWAYAVSVVALARAARPEGATSDDAERTESLRAPGARTRARRASGHHPRAGSECHPAHPEPLCGAEERAAARAVGGVGWWRREEG